MKKDREKENRKEKEKKKRNYNCRLLITSVFASCVDRKKNIRTTFKMSYKY